MLKILRIILSGNSGIRVLDSSCEAEGRLPLGFGMPFIWVNDAKDLPKEVREVIGEEKKRRKGKWYIYYEKWERLYQDGKSVEEIAKNDNASYRAVHNFLKEKGLLKKQGRPKKEE